MTEQPVQPAPAKAPALGAVCIKLQASPGVLDELVVLGFLADRDRSNADAVMEATVRLLGEGANLFKDLDTLFRSLREAKRRFDAQEDAGRQGALYALDAVLRFLMLFERVYAEGLMTLLALLFGDLVSLDGGQVGPMVAPARKRGGTRASGFYNALKGIAVFIARRLEASGMARADARRAVAKELANTGVRPARKGSREGSGEFSAQTIRKWQEDIAADIGLRTTAAQEFRLCEAEQVRRVLAARGLSCLPEGSTADDLELRHVGPAEFRRAYLKTLGRFVLDTRLTSPKST